MICSNEKHYSFLLVVIPAYLTILGKLYSKVYNKMYNKYITKRLSHISLVFERYCQKFISGGETGQFSHSI